MADAIIEQHKSCAYCSEFKPFSEYSDNWRAKDGKDHRCKVCVREYQMARYYDETDDYKDRQLANARQFNRENPGYNRQWRKNNPGYARQWRKDNPDKVAEYKRRYYAKRKARKAKGEDVHERAV